MSPGICDSVHIDGVESELVVRFGHSVQSHPKALEEVRRILRDHLHLRNDMTDAQVWITKGNNPLLHRLVIIYRHENGQPEFRADFHDWNFSTEAPDSLFTFTPAEGAARIEFVTGMDPNAGKNQERGAQP